MERKRLAKPQSNETLESVAVYACETPNNYCPTNSEPGCSVSGSGCPCGTNTLICGGSCGGICPDVVNVTYCGLGCSS